MMGSRLEQNSSAVRKRISAHTFADESGEEYSASSFGGFTDYMRRKKTKLQNLDAERRAHASTKPAIFRGVVVHVNGYTQPSLNDIHSLVVEHGGGFLQYLDGKTMVTHIVASNLTPKKRDEFKRYRIVKPAWIVDSVREGRLLPWDAYRVLDDGQRQKMLGFSDGKIVSQASQVDQRRYREQTEGSWYLGQVRQKAGDLNGPANQNEAFSLQDSPENPSSKEPEQELSDEDALPTKEDLYKDPNAAPAGLEQELGGGHGLPNEDDLYEDPNAAAAGSDEGIDEVVQDESDHRTSSRKENLPPEHDDTNSHPPNPDVPTAHPNGKLLTAEEHNAILLSDPKVWKSTVVNPGFLKQYYEESRLHHLSTWKAELKSQLQALAQEQSSSQKARAKRPKGARRYILHVDFDSFFVAVSLLKHPQYKDIPVVVAHGGGSGAEIASCNYPAREFGVKNGMWMKTAQELCPDLKVLPYDFKAYEDASRKFYDVVMSVGGTVQSVSIDEVLLDASNTCIEAGGHDGRGDSEGSQFREEKKADGLAQYIRDEVLARTQCAVSVGLGGNILQAKLALRKAKPAGQYHLKADGVLEFIGPLPVQNLPGVAYSTGNKLEEIGIKLVKDIRETSKEKLISTLGPKTGEKLWEYARGIDRVEVGEQVIRKSVSAEVNWGIRFATQEQAEEFIRSICEELEKRLLSEAVKGRQFSMKIMRRAKDAPLDPPKHLGHGKCDSFNKSVILGVATNDKAIISREALSILRGYGFPPGELRGIGVQMTKLEPLKGGTAPESSQRLLDFGKAAAPSIAPKATFKLPDYPASNQAAPHPVATPSSVRRSLFKTFSDVPISHDNDDLAPTPTRVPILRGDDEVDSPHKPKAIAQAPLQQITPVGKDIDNAALLNTTGTQFLLPTQVDPEVLAELPDDIRSRFRRASEIAGEERAEKDAASRLRSESPTPSNGAYPSQSQLDPETLAALPDDIRAEVLAQYSRPSSPRPTRQVVLPQSPRKVRTLKVPAKKLTVPAKRGGRATKGRGGRTAAISNAGFPTLTQANFVAVRASAEEQEAEEASMEFLAALPEDIRAEVTEQQRRERLRKKGGLDVLRKKRAVVPSGPMTKRTIELPPRSRPTFTSQKLSSLSQLRDAMRLWYEDFCDEEPASEDVDALATYLGKVVIEEQDMAKAVAVVKWLDWIIEDGAADAKPRWVSAVDTLKERVQAAVLERGLGRVEFA